MSSPPNLGPVAQQIVNQTVSEIAPKPPVQFCLDPENIRNTPPALFGKHHQALLLPKWAKKLLTDLDRLSVYQKQQGLSALLDKYPKLTFVADFEYKHLINRPVPEMPPEDKIDTAPQPFICLQLHYNFDRYTRKHLDTPFYITLIADYNTQ